MLEAADICPRCGVIHSETPSAGHLRMEPQYPIGSLGNYPVYTPLIPELVDLPRVPAGQRIHEFEALPAAPPRSVADTASVPRGDPGRGARRLVVSWLPPPDLGEIL